MEQAVGFGLHEVEIEYATRDGQEFEYKYKRRHDGAEWGEIETKSRGSHKQKRNDAASLADVKRIVEAMQLKPNIGREELLDSACRTLGLDRALLRKLEVEVEFDNGWEIEAKLH
jgi:hypothetical protein